MNALAEITRSLDDIAAAASLESLDSLRVALLGKSGAITAALKSLGALPPVMPHNHDDLAHLGALVDAPISCRT